MSIITEHSIEMTLTGKSMFHIFHVLENDFSIPHSQIQDVFENSFINNIRSMQNNGLVYERITSKGLDITDPRAPTVRELAISGGLAGGQNMPTGVHMWVAMQIGTPGLKGGGKLIPGLDESQFSLGEIATTALTVAEGAFLSLRLNCAVNGVQLCIYHPSISTPSLPQGSPVISEVARGASTNNRRRKPFLR